MSSRLRGQTEVRGRRQGSDVGGLRSEDGHAYGRSAFGGKRARPSLNVEAVKIVTCLPISDL